MNMRPIQFLIFVIFILASSTHASAVDIPVRIVNETGQDIMIRSVDPNDKRGRDARQGSCPEHGAASSMGDRLRPVDDQGCELDVRQINQRSLEVSFHCQMRIWHHSARTGRFPPCERLVRSHTYKEQQIMIDTLKIKESDC